MSTSTVIVPGVSVIELATTLTTAHEPPRIGTATIDVRMTLETPGGGIVFVDYTGRSNLETGAAYACPRFRTGVPELAWLNRVQAVAKGFFDPQAMTVTYPTVYELR